ncbi:uncharacterized protein KY384_001433 [Bacidia gigantensis]|uniref:uncharacterized protein n=1 Tax=Bacidia gigantensis TaxID=2732470 RepID=UPI001D05060F|nr:uncharacterized protein KY384_001433 [Bacidia gigantensis]KAG8533692.1 hypothetical protein KY384_001433 [Bacidia gigantensis]
MIDPNQLRLPELKSWKDPQIQSQIYTSLFNSTNLDYEPSERYKSRVLKKVINALENAIDDPEEDPLPSPNVAAQQKSYVTYTSPLSTLGSVEVTTLEAPSLLASSGTTGFRTWEAALHLGSFFCSQMGQDYVAGKSVLELGAGTGFLSMLCAKHLGVKHMLATDGSREVVNDMRANVQLNFPSPEKELVNIAILQWGHALLGGPADVASTKASLDLVIGADVTYDVESVPALVATLRDLFEMYNQAKVIISATVRNEDTLACFIQACNANEFRHRTLAFQLPHFAEQTGFFIIKSTRIEILEITSPEKPRDPFGF